MMQPGRAGGDDPRIDIAKRLGHIMGERDAARERIAELETESEARRALLWELTHRLRELEGADALKHMTREFEVMRDERDTARAANTALRGDINNLRVEVERLRRAAEGA